MSRFVRSGEIYSVNLNPIVGSEQGGIRPCIVVSNQICCAFSDIIYVVPITSQVKTSLPQHYFITKNESNNLDLYSNIALCEQCRPIDKKRLRQKIGTISKMELIQITECIKQNFTA